MPKIPFYVFVALFAILFQVIFNYTLTLMAGVYIVGDLGGSNFITTYTVSFYAMGNALGVPLGKPLAERVGIAKLLFICLLLFALFSWMCAISPTFPLFVLFRFFQGFVSGPFYILVNRLLAFLTPPEKKPAFTSAMLTLFVITPVLGATWGGWIAYEIHWAWVFYVNLPFILLLAWVVKTRIKEPTTLVKKISFDWVGYVLYFFGVLAIGTVLTVGQELDWFRSSLIVNLTLTGIAFLIFFVLWDYGHPYPVLKLALFKNFAFSFALLNLALLFSAYFGMVILLALWLKLYVEYTPVWIGLLLGTMAISGFLPMFLLAEKYGKTDCRIPLLIAIVLLALSCFHTMLFNVEIDFTRIALSRLLAGFGLALFLPPIFRLCFFSFPEKEIVNVVVAFQFVRALSSGLGASLYIILWQRRQVFFRDRLGSGLTVFSQKTKDFFSTIQNFQIKGEGALAELDVALERQATALALDDCFFLMGWILMGLFVLVALTVFMKKVNFFPEKSII